MKNYSKLHILFAMGIVFSSTAMVQAYGSSSKKSDSQEVSRGGGKHCMKNIEHDLSMIMKDFRKDHDVSATNSKLDALEPRIKKSVAAMKKNEEHGKMWETHENTLHRKLKEARQEVARYSEKN
ncbi:hypothetical protein KBC04_05220 [Candidatus Babeliales bacterium]|nr:hypothetical protein [Candidatus Babeliales bacterium]MBP9844146.1 hypothetical protein [Candidatus Babeliales bacterium]